MCVCSVVILAFVKSEGRKTTERLMYEAETQALLGEKTNSLEGSLKKKVVSEEEKGTWWVDELFLNDH